MNMFLRKMISTQSQSKYIDGYGFMNDSPSQPAKMCKASNIFAHVDYLLFLAQPDYI